MEGQIDRARVFGEQSTAVERIAPGFFDTSLEAEHLARYKWASRWANGRIVLDIASGTGYGASILRAAGARTIVSVDLSLDALRFGAPRYSLLAVRSDAHSLPVRTGVFETVVSLETIEHLWNPAEFCRELSRVLRPGGNLLMSTPNAVRSAGTNPYHLREMTLGELEDLLMRSGFHISGAWGQHWGPRPSIWRKIRGIRRLIWEVEHRVAVMRFLPLGLSPIYWCIRAVKI